MKLIKLLLGSVAALACSSAMSTVLLSENFNNVGTLTANGWAMQNLSAPVGPSGWFQGNTAVFSAAEGPANSYIAANFLNGAENAGGTINNWLMTPVMSLFDGLQLSFDLRLLSSVFPDTLEVLFSTNGSSINIADFSQLTSYTSASDTGWLDKSIILSGLNVLTTGRFAFHYVAQDTDFEADYIGIDSVLVQSVPEPTSLALIALALVGGAAAGRRKQH